MDHALVVGKLHGFGYFLGELGRFARRQRSVGHPAGQTLPFDVAHRKIVLPLVLAYLEDGYDARVVEIGGRFGLGVKTLYVFLTGQLPGQDHLQGHDSVETRLTGFVDDAHPAPGDLFEQFVVAEVADLCSWSWSRVRGDDLRVRRRECRRVAGCCGQVSKRGSVRVGDRHLPRRDEVVGAGQLLHAVVVGEKRLQVLG